MARKDIKRYSLEELKALRARGKTRTRADADAPVREIDADFWEHAHVVMPGPGAGGVQPLVKSTARLIGGPVDDRDIEVREVGSVVRHECCAKPPCECGDQQVSVVVGPPESPSLRPEPRSSHMGRS